MSFPRRACKTGRSLICLLAAAALIAAPLPRVSAAAPSPALPELVTPEIVNSVDRGLEYLAKTQRPDGSWRNYGRRGVYPAVMTSLAALALMSGGSTPEAGPHAREVRRAMNYILQLAESNRSGLIVGDENTSRPMYGHGFSMLFLASCYGSQLTLEDARRIKRVLDKAVELTAGAQRNGGWTYRPGQGDEGSVTVTQLQALRACRNAGIKVPIETIDQAVEYIKKCQNPDGGIRYSLSRGGGRSRAAISAAAVACFYAAGVYDRRTGGAGSEAAVVEKLVDYVKANVTVERGGDYSGYYFYTQLYMTQAMYMRGGDDWRSYYPPLAAKLMGMQLPDGSWDGDNYGTAYGTAIAAIVLQLPWGYLPIVQR